MSTPIGQNDIAWEKVFETHNLLSHIESDGFVEVNAEDLKVFREPRLMAKIDHANNRPSIMKKNDLMLFSVSNSRYRIGPYDMFQQLPEWEAPGENVNLVQVPKHLETLDVENITSENAVLYSALSSGMIEDFLGEKVEPTVSGRMRTGKFNFRLNHKVLGSHRVEVDRAQVEIDSGLEGEKAFYIIEIKNHISADFNRRQLFFPLALWQNKIDKPIRTVFLTFSNDVFDFYEFDWEDKDNMSSSHMVEHKRYVFEKRKNEKFSLYEWALGQQSVSSRLLNDVPFPQADSFERVIDLVSFLIESPKSVDDLAQHYDFDPRQSDYYFNAARFLGLAQLDPSKNRTATELAIKIFNLPPKDKYVELGKILLNFASVRDTYLRLKVNSGTVNLSDVMNIVSSSGEAFNVGEESTLRRRSQTILSWANWLIKNLD